jgi:CRISPR-associated endonuclease/helicase Cas3/CRISPR-associated endonuclease Cas3-HD
MTLPSEFDQYISHPGDTTGSDDVLLFDHLRVVAALMREELPAGKTTDTATPLCRLARTIGLTHDIGKLTTWCQRYLRGLPTGASDPYRYHGFPSAIVTRYCLAATPGVADRDAVLGSLVVARHHKLSAPPAPDTSKGAYGSTKGGTKGKYQRVENQFEDIHTTPSAHRVADTILEEVGGPERPLSWAGFMDWYDREMLIESFAIELDSRNRDEGYYGDLTRLWSTLKYADHVAATLGNEIVGPDGHPRVDAWRRLEDPSPNRETRDRESQSRLSEGVLDRYVSEELPEGSGVKRELNQLRSRARIRAVEQVDDLIQGPADVGHITLPTGFGKTYTGLAAGLRASAQTGGRLVYVLPYTSVLDQTAEEIKRVFGVDVTDPAFSLHHHLSTTLSELTSAHTDADIGRSLGALHAESWRSQLTLTTTVQLFESLAAPTARQATKIPALQDAVLVLDEPQAIPERWWKLVLELIEIVVEQYDVTVLLMTATQPGFVEYGSTSLTTTSLVGNEPNDPYTDFLGENPRVEYEIDESVIAEASVEYDTAGERLLRAAGDDDILAICNTRASAQSLYHSVLNQLSDRNDQPPIELSRYLHRAIERSGSLPNVDALRKAVTDAIDESATTDDTPILAYLSGDLRPDDRQQIIEALYSDDGETRSLLESPHPVLLVSTSVVEVGVDISFDRVYRDIAPLPNLVQSGGRCNRAFDDSIGHVIVWELDAPPDTARLPSRLIHGVSGGDQLPLLYATQHLLSDIGPGSISESRMIGPLVDQFYQIINCRYDPGDDALADAIPECNVERLADARMIDEIESYHDIIVCATVQERQAGGFESGEIDTSELMASKGAHLSAKPPTTSHEITIGNSTYLVVDAQSQQYDPVLGLVTKSG